MNLKELLSREAPMGMAGGPTMVGGHPADRFNKYDANNLRSLRDQIAASFVSCVEGGYAVYYPVPLDKDSKPAVHAAPSDAIAGQMHSPAEARFYTLLRNNAFVLLLIAERVHEIAARLKHGDTYFERDLDSDWADWIDAIKAEINKSREYATKIEAVSRQWSSLREAIAAPEGSTSGEVIALAREMKERDDKYCIAMGNMARQHQKILHLTAEVAKLRKKLARLERAKKKGAK